MTRLKLYCAKHAVDWLQRCAWIDGVEVAQVVEQTPGSVTIDFTDAGLRDLVSDARHYASEMGPDNTGDVDYRPPAQRLLAELERLGVVS